MFTHSRVSWDVIGIIEFVFKYNSKMREKWTGFKRYCPNEWFCCPNEWESFPSEMGFIVVYRPTVGFISACSR